MDLGDDPCLSTVYVGNINYSSSEIDAFEHFNSVDGAYGKRERNIIGAVNFLYNKESGKFQGQAFLLYSTVAIANYVIRKLHNTTFQGRKLWVVQSDRRLNAEGNPKHGNVRGRSRIDEAIWECEAPPRRDPGTD